MLQIQCFGIIKDLVGDSSIHVQESPHTVGELRTLLKKNILLLILFLLG
jgi:hypothetical protein